MAFFPVLAKLKPIKQKALEALQNANLSKQMILVKIISFKQIKFKFMLILFDGRE